jgi:hypothetical protein
MAATVRVGSATGVLVANGSSTVVVTADHVATSDAEGADALVRIWAGSAWSDCRIYVRDEEADLAIVVAPPELDGVGLDLLERELVPGEEIWTCGHPRGWSSVEAPVLCKGIVAGVATEERWANLEASWGNSGGALVLAAAGRPALGGITLGRAGDVDGQFDEFRNTLTRVLDRQTNQQGSAEAAKEESERLAALRRRGRALIAANVLTGPKAASLQTYLDATEADYLDWRIRAEGAGARLHAIHGQLGLASIIAEFMETHFRTGFVRFVGVTAIRKLLGTG